ncbi:hypothetical protein [Nitrososphaera viennensis]|uniref:Uncharacterized protein n=2 Tax=Nitrososphaera viennensis TaxID=1034015 RepID=A0A977ID85_9ARCH|nr:hypothetical protein [Nitrososphaera viennensis]AIC16948.1 putative DNA binding protein, Histone-like transcription factor (CBF/NF-Y) [Nitrososphaera viennensis EN76]UVS68851.1 hypothetical protein NWT39_13200 [Nitrososphaera viennensis]CBX88958.1 putative DNA binding protein, Histone-like transcription factor (CBF/NF-Y) [Nitrososphaera phage Pro-Nvie1]
MKSEQKRLGGLKFKNPWPTRVEGDVLPIAVIYRLMFLGFSDRDLSPEAREALYAYTATFSDTQ